MKFHHGWCHCRSGPTLGSPQNAFTGKMKFHHGWCHCRSGPTLGSPQNAFRDPLLVVSKKNFDVMAHPEAEWLSQKSVLIFSFSLFF